ncbi:MAG: GNAT family N-acetyltransferase [Betaproteobacteria bacterium]|nr:GNAT family N-acetyltransferase [Betaproteobacteria bacterium]
MQIIEITDGEGRIAEADWLGRAEAVHRQLRTALPDDYVVTMQRVFAGGARMCVAAAEGAVAGVAVYRVYENTWAGRQMYVDDLVTDEARRSTGVGKALLEYLERSARLAGCGSLALDSGTQRQQAHKFYFREGMVVTSFHFGKQLEQT